MTPYGDENNTMGYILVRPDHSSGRVWALLDAVVSIGADLDLHSALKRIVRAACELSGARYGAVEVLRPDGNGADVVVIHGLTADEIAEIGELPQGHGLLGMLADEDGPLRLGDVTTHPRAFGFPPEHPLMRSFLGVPVRVRGEVYANLYLAEKTSGEFTAADEHLVSTLAQSAGVMIDNARLYREASSRNHWHEATAEITRLLLGELDSRSAMRLIAARAREVSGGHLGAVLLRDGDEMVVEAIVCPGLEHLVGVRVPVDEPPVSLVIGDSESVVVEDLAQLVKEQGHVPVTTEIEELGRGVIVPMPTDVQHNGGVLVVAAHRDAVVAGGDLSTDLIASFATQATLALDRVQAQQDRATLAVLEDRDRIARELHDLVIQRLFATGLHLQGMHRMVSPAAQERIRRAVADIDTTIEDLRAAIFELHKDPDRTSLRDDVEAVVEEYTDALGFEPRVELRGPLDSVVPANVRPQLLATVREGLSNVIRHADAHEVTVEILVLGREVVARITDDGVGISWNGRESGLGNLRSRAATVGGSVQVQRVQPNGTGTQLEFRAPLVPDAG